MSCNIQQNSRVQQQYVHSKKIWTIICFFAVFSKLHVCQPYAISHKVDPIFDSHSTNNKTMIPNPTFEKVTAPCVHVQRTQFSARESPKEKVEYLVPKGFSGSNFQTLRWRKYGFETTRYKTKFGADCAIRRNFPGKVVIDLRRLQPIDLRHDVNTGNPHAPLAACSKNVYWDPSDTPVLAHHYMGTPEQWNYRAGDKRGRFCVHQHGRRTMHSFVHFIYLLMHLFLM